MARERAFKPSTIKAAFAKTGIWPMNRHALPLSAYEPSRNTTTRPAQPIPAAVPSLLTQVQQEPGERLQTPTSSGAEGISGSSRSTSTTSSSSSSSALTAQDIPAVPVQPAYQLIIPSPPYRHASREVVADHCDQLRALLVQAGDQILKDHAHLQLMEIENGRLRNIAFHKEKKKSRKKEFAPNGHSRHLTSEENLRDLAKREFSNVLKEAHPIFKQRRGEIERYMREVESQKAAEAELKRKEEAEEKKKEEAARRKAEKEAEKLRKAEEREAEKLRKAEERETEKIRKAEEREAERIRKAEERAAEKEAERRLKAQKKEKRPQAQVAAQEDRDISRHANQLQLAATPAAGNAVPLRRSKRKVTEGTA